MVSALFQKGKRPKINKIVELKICPRLHWKFVQLCRAAKLDGFSIFPFFFFYFLENISLPAERRRFLKNKTEKKEIGGRIFNSKKGNFWTDFQLYSLYIYVYAVELKLVQDLGAVLKTGPRVVLKTAPSLFVSLRLPYFCSVLGVCFTTQVSICAKIVFFFLIAGMSKGCFRKEITRFVFVFFMLLLEKQKKEKSKWKRQEKL